MVEEATSKTMCLFCRKFMPNAYLSILEEFMKVRQQQAPMDQSVVFEAVEGTPGTRYWLALQLKLQPSNLNSSGGKKSSRSTSSSKEMQVMFCLCCSCQASSTSQELLKQASLSLSLIWAKTRPGKMVQGNLVITKMPPDLSEQSCLMLISPKSISSTPAIPQRLSDAIGREAQLCLSQLGIMPTSRQPLSAERHTPTCLTQSLLESWKRELKMFDSEKAMPRMPFSSQLLAKFSLTTQPQYGLAASPSAFSSSRISSETIFTEYLPKQSPFSILQVSLEGFLLQKALQGAIWSLHSTSLLERLLLQRQLSCLWLAWQERQSLQLRTSIFWQLSMTTDCACGGLPTQIVAKYSPKGKLRSSCTAQYSAARIGRARQEKIRRQRVINPAMRFNYLQSGKQSSIHQLITQNSWQILERIIIRQAM